MKSSQHPLGVESAVMQILREHLRPSISLDDVLDYVNYDIKADAYNSAETFVRDYVYVSFLRKWKGFKHKDINPAAKALATWIDSERQCFKTNVRLETEAATASYTVAPRIISDAQRKIAQILGPLRFDRIVELCRFGSGATYDLRRGSTHAEKSCKPSVTFEAIPWVCKALSGDEYLGTLVGGFFDLTIVDSNRMVMVAKTVKTDRPIAAEPTLNSYVQQGVGRYIRERLKRFGVDLDDQTINQDLARIAKDWGLSTLDLSSASDTLCANLVKLLVPREWFELLDDLRCKTTEYKGQRFKTSKFSSMGNSYTFELESLIFYALVSSSSVTGVTSVYGDDIIVHNDDYQRTLEILTWAGFKVNEHKSFSDGSSFFESCGKHFFDGVEVTPCYQKDVCTRPHDYVRLHNRLIRAGVRLNLRREFEAAARHVRERSRERFGRHSPGVGPFVEYDEYFIREDYQWEHPNADCVRVRSAITIPNTERCKEWWRDFAYFGRKLRTPAFLNPDPKGQASESKGTRLIVSDKLHWRSASLV
ncbi:TPA_asm: RNA-directed RNA polymerase [ssRNA phage Esthiorhiza.2_52]|uniref:RNA-directed RNA polymerase n=2 Tax=Fiersviridae TaxID=2842319 RepID=A0A8S5L2R2_9VIRU|nr:RNA-directed RNA polymerase [ssRNA phage Esthiorhiza.2_52]QDH90309.1 MAG: RNA-dependent RNA polymerase [Leviviridae sp.]DAD51779.1 TPA_asm: RNA-directed RNA polymerase [ssRNA phage Esthiorhiza.2_52]